MSKFGHNPLCQQAMDIDPNVTACICDWVDAAERDTEERIIKLLEERLTGCSGYDCETCGEVEGLSAAIALFKGENK